MYADPSNPGIKQFREIRAREKKVGVLRAEIMVNNPDLSQSHANEIALASLRAAERSAATTIKVKGRRPSTVRGRQHNKNRKPKTRSVEVQVVNRLTTCALLVAAIIGEQDK